MPNLNECLLAEIDRNKDLLRIYKNLGPAGMFGATHIEADIKRAEQALAEQDAVKMLEMLTVLKEKE